MSSFFGRGPQGPVGPRGGAASVRVGSTTTGEPGGLPKVYNSGTVADAVLDFELPYPKFTVSQPVSVPFTDPPTAALVPVGTVQAPQQYRLDLGIPVGRAATVKVGTVTTGQAGSSALVVNSGDDTDAVFDFTIPRGDTGAEGRAATVTVGSVVSGATPSIVNSGTSTDAVLDFVLPKGDTGAQGPQGPTGATGAAATIAVGSVASGSTPSVVNSGTSAAAVFDFVLPKGDTGSQGPTGPTGPQGPAGTIAVGTVSTGAAGTNASVTNVGTAQAAVLNFVIPRGNTGATGPTGPAWSMKYGHGYCNISGSQSNDVSFGEPAWSNDASLAKPWTYDSASHTLTFTKKVLVQINIMANMSGTSANKPYSAYIQLDGQHTIGNSTWCAGSEWTLPVSAVFSGLIGVGSTLRSWLYCSDSPVTVAALCLIYCQLVE